MRRSGRRRATAVRVSRARARLGDGRAWGSGTSVVRGQGNRMPRGGTHSAQERPCCTCLEHSQCHRDGVVPRPAERKLVNRVQGDQNGQRTPRRPVLWCTRVASQPPCSLSPVHQLAKGSPPQCRRLDSLFPVRCSLFPVHRLAKRWLRPVRGESMRVANLDAGPAAGVRSDVRDARGETSSRSAALEAHEPHCADGPRGHSTHRAT